MQAKWRVAAGGGKGFGGSDDSEAATSTPAPATTQVSLWVYALGLSPVAHLADQPRRPAVCLMR